MTSISTPQQLQSLLQKTGELQNEIARRIVGQKEVSHQLLIALLAGGHALLEGVPGLAKTLLVKTLAEATSLSFRRIQFTPDLMPTDITGTDILEEDPQTGKRHFRFSPGPLFANLVLADEINRTPPKTQAALLEAMQEYAITYAGKSYPLEKPFFILATQNPVEQAGTFPLPEAQMDRFLLLIRIGYPAETDELRILQNTTGTHHVDIRPILSGEELIALQQLVRQVSIADELLAWINQLVRATRPGEQAPAYINDYVDWGAGPRAGQSLVLAAKACALLAGRLAVVPSDIEQLAAPVLRHRMLCNFKADAEKITPDQLTQRLLGQFRP